MPGKGNDNTSARGHEAETRAANFLTARGLRLISRNFRVRGGEIDLICEEGDSVVFIEVRSRRNHDFGGAGASITIRKQQRIILAARHYLARHGETNCRFDCVLIDAGHIEWIRNAFSAAD